MVDTGERCVVGDGLEGRAGPVAISRGSHFPAELHGRLVDASLIAALLHDSIFGEMGVAGRDTDQRVARGGGFLDSLLGDLFHMVIISECNDLPRSHIDSPLGGYQEGQRTKAPFPRDLQDHLTLRDSLKHSSSSNNA